MGLDVLLSCSYNTTLCWASSQRTGGKTPGSRGEQEPNALGNLRRHRDILTPLEPVCADASASSEGITGNWSFQQINVQLHVFSSTSRTILCIQAPLPTLHWDSRVCSGWSNSTGRWGEISFPVQKCLQCVSAAPASQSHLNKKKHVRQPHFTLTPSRFPAFLAFWLTATRIRSLWSPVLKINTNAYLYKVHPLSALSTFLDYWFL